MARKQHGRVSHFSREMPSPASRSAKRAAAGASAVAANGEMAPQCRWSPALPAFPAIPWLSDNPKIGR
jgi:hypothetical protein